MHSAPTDFDAATVPPFSPYDGIEGLWQDDDRKTDMWSPYFAVRVNTCLRITRERVRIFQWQVQDVTPRGNADAVARAESLLAAAQAELKDLEIRRDLLEAARVKTSFAPKNWTWE